MRLNFLGCWMLAVTILPAVAFGQAARPSFTQLLPEETVLVVRLENAAEFRDALSGSGIGKLLKDPQMSPFVEQLVGDFGSWVAEQGQDLNLQLGELAAIPQGEVGFALLIPKLVKFETPRGDSTRQGDNPEPQTREGLIPQFILLVEGKERVGTLRDLLLNLEARAAPGIVQVIDYAPGIKIHAAGESPDRNPCWVEKDGVIVASSDVEVAKTFLKNWEAGGATKSLAAKTSFGSAITPCVSATEETPQITFFFDPLLLIRELSSNNTGMKFGLQLLDKFGLGNIKGIGASVLVGAKEYDSVMHAHLVLDGPRDGVLAVIQPQTGNLRPEKWVPADISAFSATRWNVSKSVDGVERIVEKIAGSTYWENSVEKPFKDRSGVDLRDDWFSQLNGQVNMVQWFEPPARLGSQVMLFAAEVKDPAAMEKTLETMLEKFKATEPRETYLSAKLYPLRAPRRPQNTSENELLRVGKPHVMLMDKYLFFSDSRPLLEKIARTFNDPDAQRLSEQIEFDLVATEATALLDGKEPFYLSFVDPTESLRPLYELAQSPQVRDRLGSIGANFAPAGILGRALADKKLPPLAVVKQYFAPRGSAAYDEPTGLHFFSFTLRPLEEK